MISTASVLFNGQQAVFSPGIKWLEAKADVLPLYSAVVSNEWSYSSNLHTWFHGLYRDKLHFYLYLYLKMQERL